MLAQEWLGKDNKLGQDIWKNKYQYNDETFDEWLDRISNGNKELKQLIIDKKFLFGGRILSNRGLQKLGKKVTYSNCYVIPQVEDNIESIYDSCSKLGRTFSYGGGCGLDISKLRPRGAKVDNASEETTGACSFMETFSQVTETIGQNGRRGALMLSIDCNHPDLEEFIDIKTDLNRVTKANISVKITDDFMKAVENDDEWELYFKTEHDEEIRKKVKAKNIFLKLCENNWNYAEPGILYWNRIENYNIVSEDSEFKYDGVNPCAEEPLPAGGSCLLGSFNLSAYVKNGEFDYNKFKNDIPIVVKAMNDILDEGLPLHPLQIQKDTVKDWRQIGIGIMGLGDMLIKLGMKYADDESLKLCEKIGFTLANESLKSSALLAKEYGKYPKYKLSVINSPFVINNTDSETYELISKYGLRNSQILTTAPTGSISTMIGITGGIEPIFEKSYTRKTESLHDEDVYYKVYTPIVAEFLEKNNITEEELPDYFITAMELDPLNRVKMQGTWQKHIDASISSTVNLPNEATIDDVYNVYMQAWKEGCKGITIYRSGCAREGILTTKEVKENKELNRGEWKSLAEDTYYVKENLSIGCGKLKLFIGYSPSEKTIQDLYIIKCGNGGCTRNLQALAISMSAVLRLGGNLDNLEKAFRGIDPCNSFISARAKGRVLSKGTYCGNAILNCVKNFLEKQNVEEKEDDTKAEKNISDLTKQELLDNGLCPECKTPLNHMGGCVSCPNCAYTKCE